MKLLMNCPRSLQYLAGLAGLAALGAIAAAPAAAQLNPSPSIFDEPPYNQSVEASDLAITETLEAEETPELTQEPGTPAPMDEYEPMAGEMETPEAAITAQEPLEPPVPEAVQEPDISPETPGVETPDTTPVEQEPLEPPVPEAVQEPDTLPEETEVENPAEPTATETSNTIVDIAAADSSFSTLVAALEAADLTPVLAGEGPYTVFAPTNAAFEALPPGTVDALLQPENRELLIQVLSYHVVPGEITSDALTSGEVTTAEGSPINVVVEGAAVTVNNATVTQPDIQAENGVIHVIDRVIIPPGL